MRTTGEIITPYLFPQWTGRTALVVRVVGMVALVIGWMMFIYHGPTPWAGIALIAWVAMIARDYTVWAIRAARRWWPALADAADGALDLWRTRKTGGTLQGPRPTTEDTP